MPQFQKYLSITAILWLSALLFGCSRSMVNMDEGAQEAEDNRGFKSIHFAAYDGLSEKVSSLLESDDAKVNDTTSAGWTPLHLAAKQDHDDIVQLLLDKNAPIEARDKQGHTPLHLAADAGHDDIVQLLLDEDALIEARDKQGHTPIHLAAENGHDDAIEVLLDPRWYPRADINARDSIRRTPLHLSVKHGYPNAISMLLAHGASLEAKDNDGWRPLHYATFSGRYGTVRLLLDQKAEVDVQDNNGATPLHIAAYKGQDNIVQLLLERKASSAVQDKIAKCTPLHIAASYGRDEMIQMLLAHEASSIKILDKHGRTPLDIAVSYGRMQTTALLLKHEAVFNTSNEALRRDVEDRVAAGNYEEAAGLLIRSHQEAALLSVQQLQETSDDTLSSAVSDTKKPALGDQPESEQSRPEAVLEKMFDDAMKMPDDDIFSSMRLASESKEHLPSISAKTPSAALPTVYEEDESSPRLYDVFISHAGTDKETIAIPLYEELSARNPHMRVFLDRPEIPYEENAPAYMVHAMNTARCGVFILSPEFAAKKWPMKELDCFLKRKQVAKNVGIPPFLIPVFYRLTLQDCALDGSAFFKRYQSVFEEPAYKFSDREKKGEISVAGIMQSLQALKICRGVELGISGEQPLTYTLIEKTADEVYKKISETLPLASLLPGTASGQLHDHIDFPKVFNYIQRAQATKEVDAALNKQGICVIHGFGGSGKSTLAVKYAKDNQEDQIIRFVSAASSNHALTEGFQRIAHELGQDWRALAKFHRGSPREYHKALGQLVYRTMAEKEQRLFLIIDNVEAQHTEIIQDMLHHSVQAKVKVIITTRNPQCFQREYPQIVLADFSEPEGRAYVSQELQDMDREADANAVTALLAAVDRTPMELDLAMRYLKETYMPLSDYIKQLRQSSPGAGVRPQVEMGIAHVSAPSQLLLHYCALLDVTAIPLSLLCSFMSQDAQVLREKTLAPLERLSLVKFLPDRESIQMHPSVQDSVRHYRAWSEEANASEAPLLARLVAILHNKMPRVDDNPDDSWAMARLYAPQAAQVVQRAAVVLGNTPGVAALFVLMGKYRLEVDCAYSQGLEYLEQALEMCKALNKGQQYHMVIAALLDDVGNVYNDHLSEVRKGLEYKEQALEMRKALYKDQDHPDVAQSLNNVGVAYESLGEVKKGLEYQEQSLAMCKALYPDQNHPAVATSLNNVGMAYKDLGEVQKGLEYLAQALEMRKALYEGQDHPDVALSLNNMGTAYEALGAVQKGLEYYEQALEMRKALYPDQNHPAVATSLNNMGTAYESLGEVQKGLEYLAQALEMRKALYEGQDHPDVALSLNNVGISYHSLGEIQQGLGYFEQSLTMYKALYKGHNHPNVAMSLNNVGGAYRDLGEAQKGLEYFEQSLTMYKALYKGHNHPAVARLLNNVGSVYADLGEVQKGLEYKEQSLAMYKALYQGQNHPNVAQLLNNVGSAYYTLGKVQKGLEYQKQALEMYKALYKGQDHHIVAILLSNVGVAYTTLGEVQKGLEYQEQALAMRQALYPGQNHLEVAALLNSVGVAYEALGEVQKGLAYKEEALAMRQALYPGQNHPDVATSLNNVGLAYAALGAVQKGLEYFEQSLAMFKALYKGENHPNVAASLNNVGLAYEALGAVQKGLEYFEQSLAMYKALYKGQDHPRVAALLNSVGVAYEALGEVQKGLEYQEQALAMRQALYPGQNHLEVADLLNSVGSAYGDLGAVQKGLEYQEQALEMYKALYPGENHLEVAKLLNKVGITYGDLGEIQKGLEHQEQAREMFKALSEGKNHPDVASSLNKKPALHAINPDQPLVHTLFFPTKVSEKMYDDDTLSTYPSTMASDDMFFAASFASKSKGHLPSISAKTPGDALLAVGDGYHAFGAQAWQAHFGVDVGAEPALPDDIVSILNEEAPFMLDRETSPQRVGANHLLTLIPSHVTLSDGRRVPFTLDQLGELVKERYFPNNAEGYGWYNTAVRTQFGAESPNRSYWLLMTCDILQGTRDKAYADQQEVVKQYSSQGWELPSGLEAATSILACYAQSGNRKERLFGASPWTYTRCTPKQLIDGEWPLAIGGFGPAGLSVIHSNYGHSGRGVACCRKFY
ncbi:MAG: tetratricopeptide repeat protein [Bacteroidota bacterium]